MTILLALNGENRQNLLVTGICAGLVHMKGQRMWIQRRITNFCVIVIHTNSANVLVALFSNALIYCIIQQNICMMNAVFGIKVRMSGLCINRYRPIVGRLLDADYWPADNRPLPYRCISNPYSHCHTNLLEVHTYT